MLLDIIWSNNFGIKATNPTTNVYYVFEPSDIEELTRMKLIEITQNRQINVMPGVDLFSFVLTPIEANNEETTR